MSYLLRLRQFINHPETLDMSQEWVMLDKSAHPAILVYGKDLSIALLKPDKVAPTNFIEYYKKLLQLSNQNLPTIDAIFVCSPVLLYGDEHAQSRKTFSKKYKLIEENLQNWLPSFTSEFFSLVPGDEEINPIQLVANYIAGIFRTILATDLGVSVSEIPSLPPKLFFLTHPLAKVIDVEDRLRALKEYLEKTMLHQGRDLSEVWILLAIIVAGFEALEGTLMYGLTKEPASRGTWEAKSLLREAAAVNFIGRRALENFSIGNLTISKNQEIYVCPTLVHRYMDAKNLANINNSFSFGKGAHTCIGQVISTAVINSFFAEWSLFVERHPKIAAVKYTRDFNLTFILR